MLVPLINNIIQPPKTKRSHKRIEYARFDAHVLLQMFLSGHRYFEYVDTDGVIRKQGMGKQKMFLFARDKNTCSTCGLVGEIYALEQQPKERYKHLRLYGIRNGELVLMTFDHIMPRSKNGSNKNHNLQTMCRTCNHKKADFIVDPFLAAKYRYENFQRFKS